MRMVPFEYPTDKMCLFPIVSVSTRLRLLVAYASIANAYAISNLPCPPPPSPTFSFNENPSGVRAISFNSTDDSPPFFSFKLLRVTSTPINSASVAMTKYSSFPPKNFNPYTSLLSLSFSSSFPSKASSTKSSSFEIPYSALFLFALNFAINRSPFSPLPLLLLPEPEVVTTRQTNTSPLDDPVANANDDLFSQHFSSSSSSSSKAPRERPKAHFNTASECPLRTLKPNGFGSTLSALLCSSSSEEEAWTTHNRTQSSSPLVAKNRFRLLFFFFFFFGVVLVVLISVRGFCCACTSSSSSSSLKSSRKGGLKLSENTLP